MKSMVCEMCGSNDIVKKDGLYVCQFCGTKYSVEDAKKMMIDGTVNVQGTVKIDKSETVQKNLMNARRTYADEDYEEAEKYYGIVREELPDNLEAMFFYTCCQLKATRNIGIFKKKANTLTNTIRYIGEQYHNSDDEKELLKKMFREICGIKEDKYNYQLSDVIKKIRKNFFEVCKEISKKYDEEFLKKIVSKFEAEQKEEIREKLKGEQKVERERRYEKWGTIIGVVIAMIVSIIIYMECNKAYSYADDGMIELIGLSSFGALGLLLGTIGWNIGRAIARNRN